jgi:non-specific serine/threonine protein kinase
LSLPPEDEQLSIDELAEYEAIRLFIERADSVKPGFKLDSSNARDLSKICWRLDGIPLAIELAAARVTILTPKQIAERLDDRFRLLTGGSRTALPRQRTLKALIDWSYDLLSNSERTLLCRLSVFTGGWTLEAAEQVAGFEPIESFEVLDLLDQLVNKSLVIVDNTDLGVRYHLLESIRHYAQEKLAENGAGELMRQRHSLYYFQQSEQSFDALLKLQPPGDWGIRFKPEADNFRSAWAWALDNDLISALGFASTFSLAWSQVLPLIEIHRFQKSVLDLAASKPRFSDLEGDEEDLRFYSGALLSASRISFATRLLPLAVEYAERSLAIANELGDMAIVAWTRSLLSSAASFTGGKEYLNKWLEEDYILVMEHGNDFMKATHLVRWGTFQFYATGRYDQESIARWETGMAMMRRSGNLWNQGSTLQMAADLSKARGDLGEARRIAEQVQDIYGDLGDIYAANPARSLLADIARQEGEFELAVDLYRKTILVWRDTGRAESGVRTLESLAFTMHGISKSEPESTRHAYLAYAIKLISAADAVRKSIGLKVNFVDKAEYDRELAEIKSAAGETDFQAAWQIGQSMDFDQVILMTRDDPS